MWDLASIYVPANRIKLLVIAGLLVTAIAVVDWLTKPYISLGFLYLFPIMIVGGYLSRKQIIVIALGCAYLQEAFSDLPGNEALVRLVFSSAGFIGTGLFISELVNAQQGFFYPTIQANSSPSRQKASANLSPPLSTSDLLYNLFTSQVTVGFTPDVFGGNRRQVESLRGLAESQRFQLEATYVTLTSNVVAAAVQQASLRAQIAATQDIIEISTKSLALVRRQFELGAVAGLDVAAQEAALAQVLQTLPPLQKQLEQNRDLLTALAGDFPSEDSFEQFELSAIRLPAELPVSFPSKLVEQRPDVRAAEEQLHSASAQIGAAIANRLPQFTITAAYGGVATDFTKTFAAGNPYWLAAGNVAQTLFAGGTLLHRQRAAEAAFEQAAAQYRSTVLTAFQNVADTLYALQSDAESLKAAVAAERAAKLTLDITLKQQQLGAVSYLALLISQQAYQQTLITRVQAQANRFADTAALFQALGGGWWNRP